jgi:hypothetical protein
MWLKAWDRDIEGRVSLGALFLLKIFSIDESSTVWSKKYYLSDSRGNQGPKIATGKVGLPLQRHALGAR